MKSAMDGLRLSSWGHRPDSSGEYYQQLYPPPSSALKDTVQIKE